METIQFEHKGNTYVLREPTVFDEALESSILLTVADGYLKEADIETYTDIPRIIDRLITLCCKWMMVTSIEGDSPLANVNPAIGQLDYDTFLVWRDLVLADNQSLASKWSQAYDKVTKGEDSPLVENSGVNG